MFETEYPTSGLAVLELTVILLPRPAECRDCEHNHTHPKGGLQAWQTEGKSENGEAVGLTFKGQASKEKSLRRRLAARSRLRFLG